MTSDKTLNSIERIRNLLLAGEDKVRLAVGLRKDFSAELGSFVLSQAELQLRARQKFTRADQMLFSRVGLEQATSEVLANYKVSIIKDDTERFDVCCGIGGDAIGLAKNHSLTCVDRDPVTCCFAQHNLSVYQAQEFEVIQKGFTEIKFPSRAWIHLDPDRRTQGRTTRAENFSPSLNEILERLELASNHSSRAACIKLAPITELESTFPVASCRHWIGHQRECKQQLLWLDPELSADSKRVTVIDSQGADHSIEFPELLDSRVVSPRVEKYLYEPHAAVLAADVVDEFSTMFGVGRLSFGSVYLTGPELIETSLASRFELLESCAMKSKAIEGALKTHDIGEVEWKSRGLDRKTVNRLSRCRANGSKKGVVILTRLGSKFTCFVCRRIQQVG